MTILWSNNASTTVSGSITAVSTTVALAAGTGVLFPAPTGTDYFCATFYDQATKTQNEIVHVTNVTGDVATIVRAQEGTVARAWNAGDIFANLITAGTLRNFVQSGAGPSPTTPVYTGIDVSTTPGLVVCNTVPVPVSYAIGMLFNIKINNTNPGPTQLQFNGTAPVAAVRTDGSPMVAGNLISSQEMAFIYNGVNFNSLIPPIPQAPPQTTFYVRTDGNDNNSGFANTPSAAFATISGAMYAIKTRYISQTGITLRVADGSYVDSFGESTNYIASWNIIGNTAAPGNVIIDATSISAASYAAHPYAIGSSCGCGSAGIMSVSGMTFRSHYQNASAGSSLTLTSCGFTAPIDGSVAPIVSAANGDIRLYGNCSYNGATAVGSIFICAGGAMGFGSYNSLGTGVPLFFNIVGTPIVTYATMESTTNGKVTIDYRGAAFSGGTPACPEYACIAGGGIFFAGGRTDPFPGTMAGFVTPPGWTA